MYEFSVRAQTIPKTWKIVKCCIENKIPIDASHDMVEIVRFGVRLAAATQKQINLSIYYIIRYRIHELIF